MIATEERKENRITNDEFGLYGLVNKSNEPSFILFDFHVMMSDHLKLLEE